MTVTAGIRPAQRSGSRPGRAWRPRVGVVVLGAAVLAATALGGLQLYRSTVPVADPMALNLAGVTYTVTHVEEVAGLSDADMSGMSHGIQGLVSDDQALIRVTLTVSTDNATTYDPSLLYVEDGQGGAPLAPVGGSLAPGGLGAGAHIEGSLGFVVPRAGEHLTLHAPGNAGSVDLLTVDQAPPGAGEHEHSPTDPSVVPDDPATDPSTETQH